MGRLTWIIQLGPMYLGCVSRRRRQKGEKQRNSNMKGAQPHIAGFEDAEREQKLKNGGVVSRVGMDKGTDSPQYTLKRIRHSTLILPHEIHFKPLTSTIIRQILLF